MSNLQKCPNGHMYDPSTNSQCPHCRSKQTTGGMTEAATGTKTAPVQGASPFASAKTEPLLSPPSGEGLRSAATTPGFITQAEGEARPFNPIVGWLVAIEGPARGQDFRLVSGKNVIGREAPASVQIAGDEQISRSHATLYYYPKVNAFYLEDHSTHGTFHKGEPVIQRTRVESMEVIELGKTKLLLRALCDASFTWEELNA